MPDAVIAILLSALIAAIATLAAGPVVPACLRHCDGARGDGIAPTQGHAGRLNGAPPERPDYTVSIDGADQGDQEPG